MTILENSLAKILINRFKANDENSSLYYFWVFVDLTNDGEQTRELISSEKGETSSEKLIELLKEAEAYAPENVVVVYNKKRVLPNISKNSSTVIRMNDSTKSEYESLIDYVDEKYDKMNSEQSTLGSLGELTLKHTQETLKRDARDQIAKMQHERELEKLEAEIRAKEADFEEQKTLLLKLEEEKENLESEFDEYRTHYSGAIKDSFGPLAMAMGSGMLGKLLPGGLGDIAGLMGMGDAPSQSQTPKGNSEVLVQGGELMNTIISDLAAILPTLSEGDAKKIYAILVVVTKDEETLEQIYSLIHDKAAEMEASHG